MSVLSRLLLIAQRPFVSSDNPQDGGHPQSSSCEFRCKERFKDAALNLLVHAAPVVGHLEIHIPSLGQVLFDPALAQVGRVTVHDVGCNANHAILLPQRFGCVDDQIHDDLAHLGGVGADGRKILREVVLQQGPFRDGDFEDMDHFAYQACQVDF